jgi:hypothetical protein
MPNLPRACPAGDYTCGALVHHGSRYCHDHDHLEPPPSGRRRRRNANNAIGWESEDVDA